MRLESALFVPMTTSLGLAQGAKWVSRLKERGASQANAPSTCAKGVSSGTET